MEQLNAILVIDDDRDVLEAAQLALSPYSARIDTSLSPDGVAGLLASTEYDCVLLDMNYGAGRRGGAEGMTVLGQLKAADPTLGVVLMTAYGAISLAVEGLKLGADDFLLKPWRNKSLVDSVRRAAERTRSARELATLDDLERSAIARALGRHEGNIAQAASALGLSRPALYRRMAKHGL
ncbi:response regulator [Sphingosinicella sp. CPCC 101087]|uniref:response regulator n=1 Tax=Sphingosinicella sp. CPCC 101087 TaxID=2497754 RepID=UPI0013EC5E8A|nr:response regulator [Sphingosinicella sp. CPCC 101087]